jgi:hypothetical protein
MVTKIKHEYVYTVETGAGAIIFRIKAPRILLYLELIKVVYAKIGNCKIHKLYKVDTFTYILTNHEPKFLNGIGKMINDGKSIQHMHIKIRGNYEAVLMAILINPTEYQYATKSIRIRRDVIKFVMMRQISQYRFMPEHAQRNNKFVLECLKSPIQNNKIDWEDWVNHVHPDIWADVEINKILSNRLPKHYHYEYILYYRETRKNTLLEIRSINSMIPKMTRKLNSDPKIIKAVEYRKNWRNRTH